MGQRAIILIDESDMPIAIGLYAWRTSTRRRSSSATSGRAARLKDNRRLLRGVLTGVLRRGGGEHLFGSEQHQRVLRWVGNRGSVQVEFGFTRQATDKQAVDMA